MSTRKLLYYSGGPGRRVSSAPPTAMATAIDPKYLQALHTPGTNKLRQTIPQIFDHLFATYGDVTPQDL